MKRAVALGLVFLLFVTVPESLQGVQAVSNTINVPADYATIQEAVNAASDGNVIRVSPGRYYEGVTVNKSVSVIGDSPATTTVYGTVEGYQPNNIGNPFHISADNVVIERCFFH